jgi:hypothetical protein
MHHPRRWIGLDDRHVTVDLVIHLVGETGEYLGAVVIEVFIGPLERFLILAYATVLVG